LSLIGNAMSGSSLAVRADEPRTGSTGRVMSMLGGQVVCFAVGEVAGVGAAVVADGERAVPEADDLHGMRVARVDSVHVVASVCGQSRAGCDCPYAHALLCPLHRSHSSYQVRRRTAFGCFSISPEESDRPQNGPSSFDVCRHVGDGSTVSEQTPQSAADDDICGRAR